MLPLKTTISIQALSSTDKWKLSSLQYDACLLHGLTFLTYLHVCISIRSFLFKIIQPFFLICKCCEHWGFKGSRHDVLIFHRFIEKNLLLCFKIWYINVRICKTYQSVFTPFLAVTMAVKENLYHSHYV